MPQRCSKTIRAPAGTSPLCCCMQYLVKRKGCDYTDYGVVDAQAAKRQRLAASADSTADTAPACPVSLALVDDYEVRTGSTSTGDTVSGWLLWNLQSETAGVDSRAYPTCSVLTGQPSNRMSACRHS
jgi:hypothetical protein